MLRRGLGHIKSKLRLDKKHFFIPITELSRYRFSIGNGRKIDSNNLDIWFDRGSILSMSDLRGGGHTDSRVNEGNLLTQIKKIDEVINMRTRFTIFNRFKHALNKYKRDKFKQRKKSKDFHIWNTT